MQSRVALFTIASIMVATLALAAPPTINHVALSCLATSPHTRISATVPGGADQVRVYFRAADGCGDDDYYIDMTRGAGDEYTAILPLPKRATSSVIYRIVARNGVDETATSEYTVPVSSACTDGIVDNSDRRSKDIVVGQTDAEQPGQPCGFLCDRIVSLIDIRGEMSANHACRRLWLPYVVGFHVIGAGTSIIVEDRNSDPISPSRP